MPRATDNSTNFNGNADVGTLSISGDATCDGLLYAANSTLAQSLIMSETIYGTNYTITSRKTLDTTAGTLTTSTAQKQAIVDGTTLGSTVEDVLNTDKNANGHNRVVLTSVTLSVGTWDILCHGSFFTDKNSSVSYFWIDEGAYASMIDNSISTVYAAHRQTVVCGATVVVSSGTKTLYWCFSSDDGSTTEVVFDSAVLGSNSNIPTADNHARMRAVLIKG